MYAVIETGGKQYKVCVGQSLNVEKMEGEIGSQVTLDKVLLVGGDEVKVGRPVLEGAQVTATIQAQDRGPKIVVFKKKRRKGFRKTRGHRQYLTTLKITDIKA